MSADLKDLVERLRDEMGSIGGPSYTQMMQQRLEAATALEAQAEEIARLSDENDELRCAPWPEWASKVLAVIRARSGYDGYDDAIDGVDLPAELEETMAVLEREADRQMQDARAKRETDLHKGAADHYRKKCAEHRANAEAAERERDALKAENERLRVLVERATDIFRNCSVEDGMCCCGDDMKRHPHPMECGHSPTDHGGYIADQWLKDYSALHPTQGGE